MCVCMYICVYVQSSEFSKDFGRSDIWQHCAVARTLLFTQQKARIFRLQVTSAMCNLSSALIPSKQYKWKIFSDIIM